MNAIEIGTEYVLLNSLYGLRGRRVQVLRVSRHGVDLAAWHPNGMLVPLRGARRPELLYPVHYVPCPVCRLPKAAEDLCAYSDWDNATGDCKYVTRATFDAEMRIAEENRDGPRRCALLHRARRLRIEVPGFPGTKLHTAPMHTCEICGFSQLHPKRAGRAPACPYGRINHRTYVLLQGEGGRQQNLFLQKAGTEELREKLSGQGLAETSRRRVQHELAQRYAQEPERWLR